MSGGKIAPACCVISRSVCSTGTETVPLSKDDSPTSSSGDCCRGWKATMKLHLLPPCWKSEAAVSGSHEETRCKHWRRRRGVGSLSTPKQHPYCRQRDAPQYCWRPTPNTAQITLFTETASPVPLSPTFSKHLLRRDTQRKQDNLGTTVRPRNSGQNNSASERPKATPVPSRTWTCALQTTFMPVELAFSWLPGIRGLFFSGCSCHILSSELGTMRGGADRKDTAGVNALETNAGS